MSQDYISLPQGAPPSPQAQYIPQPGYVPQGQYIQQPGYVQPAPGGYVQPTAVGGYNSNSYQAPGYVNQPIPQPGIAAHRPLLGGIQFVYVIDPMAELALSTGVLIRQEAQFMEQITGCESPNRYYVFSQSPQGGMKLLFKCKEYSECCMRNCCPASTREINMAIKHIATVNNLDENFTAPFVEVNKPFKCTCCCLERPEMLVSFGGTKQPLGRIKQMLTCCDPLFNIYDNTGSLRYILHGDCCQCGLCCANNFCGKLSEVIFNLYSSENRTNPIGSIIKKGATTAELVTSADSYQVNFPANSSPQDKMLLIVSALMIDYQFFEERASENVNSGGNY